MRKISLLLFCLFVLTSCVNYYDDSTYTCNVEFRNNTSDYVSLLLKPEKKWWETYTYASDKSVGPGTVKQYSVSWVPGKFTVLNMDGYGVEDEVMFVDYNILSSDKTVKRAGGIRAPLQKDSERTLIVYETYAKDEYTKDEAANLIPLLTEEEQSLFEKYYNFDFPYGCTVAGFEEYMLGDDENENKDILKQFDGIIEKYNLEKKLNFIVQAI
jgi:hypothetical protein